MKFSNFFLASLAITGTLAGKNKEQKQKDKKSRLLRNLRKEAPVRLNNDGEVIFDDDSLGMQCLTSSTAQYQGLGQLSFEEARIFICQSKTTYCSVIFIHKMCKIFIHER